LNRYLKSTKNEKKNVSEIENKSEIDKMNLKLNLNLKSTKTNLKLKLKFYRQK